MSDITYSVEVQYLQSGSFAAGIDKLSDKTTKWSKGLMDGVAGFAHSFNSALDKVGSSVLNSTLSTVGQLSAAGAAGFALAAVAAMNFNEQIESTTIALASIANANGLVASMGDGMRVAGEVVGQMRRDAAALPGEFKDLESIMQSIANAGSQLGIGEFGMEKMAAKAMTAGAIMGLRGDIVGRELSAIIEGNARHQMPLFRKLGLGMTAHEWNNLDATDRFHRVSTRLQEYNGSPDDPGSAVGRYARSWVGIKTTGIDMLRQSVGFAAAPLMNTIQRLVAGEVKHNSSTGKDELDRSHSLFGWFADHKQETLAFGEKVATALEKAFLGAIEGVKHWYPIVATFANTLYDHLQNAWKRVGPLMAALFSHLERFMLDEHSIDKLLNVAKTLLAIRVGMGVAEGGLGLVGSMGGSGGLFALGEAVPPVLAAMAALSLAAYGVTAAVLDTESAFHNLTTQQLTTLGRHTTEFGDDLKNPNGIFTRASEALGLAAITFADTWVLSAIIMEKGVGAFVSGLESNLTKMLSAFGVLLPTEAPDLHTPFNYAGSVKAMDAGGAEKERKAPITNINVREIRIEVNSNQDPSRIAKATFQILNDQLRNPKTAGLTGAPRFTQ